MCFYVSANPGTIPYDNNDPPNDAHVVVLTSDGETFIYSPSSTKPYMDHFDLEAHKHFYVLSFMRYMRAVDREMSIEVPEPMNSGDVDTLEYVSLPTFLASAKRVFSNITEKKKEKKK